MKRVRLFLANLGLRMPRYPLVSPPLGIMYLAAYLRSRLNTDIRLVNQKLDNLSNDRLVRLMVEFEPEMIGLCAMTPSAFLLPDLVTKIRSALPRAKIVLGGPHMSTAGARAVETSGVDVGVIGEGEIAFEHIVKSFLEGGAFKHIPGVIWRGENGEIVANPGRLPMIEHLDDLPMPAYDLIDPSRYWRRQSMPPIPRRRYVSLFSSRGCPYHCIYCHRIFGDRYRFHSPERIVAEIELLTSRYGANDIEFLDDIFNLHAERVIETCDLIRKKNLKIRIAFPNGVRSDLLTPETIDALVDAGMYFCSFALESGSPRIQKLIHKHLDIPRFLKSVAYSARRGVFTNGFSMIGFPGETETDMRQTIDVACGSRLHTASFFTVTPFPGTEIFRMLTETRPELIRRLDYDNMNFSNWKGNCTDLPDERLYHFQRLANLRFYMNPLRLARMIHDFPQPHLLPLYLPEFLLRTTKGLATH